MKIIIINYNAGNVRSVYYALKRIGIEGKISADKKEIKSADKIIFPGVGEASSTMEFLKSTGLDQLILQYKKPLLGICLGLQLLCRYSEEGSTQCLGVFPNKVKKFVTSKKIPHMGWNNIYFNKHPLFKGIPQNAFVYFIHSFYAEINKFTISQSKYNQTFSAALQKNNYFALQFHPEKSGFIGEKILKNFILL